MSPLVQSTLVRRVRSLFRSNAAIYLLGTILSRVGGIVLIPLYTRRLTPQDYGEYSLAVSLLQLLPMCGSLGLTAGLSRVYFSTNDREDSARAMGAVARGMMGVVAVLLGLTAAGIALFAPPNLLGVQRRHWLLVVAGSLGAACFSIPDLFFRAAQQPRRAVTLQLTSFLLTAGLGLLFVLALRRGLTGALEATTLAWLVVGTFGALFVFFRLPKGAVGTETRKAILFSLPFVPHYLASWLQLTADRWVLSGFGAAASLGSYYLAVQLLSPIPMITAAWNDAESPRFGELYRSRGAHNAYGTLGRLYRTYVLVALVPCALLLVGSPLLPIVIGPKFMTALTVLPFLGAAYVVDALYYPAANFLFYFGRTGLIPFVTVTSGVLGVGLAILLLPRFGLLGLLASRVAASITRSAVIALAAFLVRPHRPTNGP